ncbi:ATP-binding protein [Sphingopyxis sp. BSNA05]|uniref:ATP-binding protein n=1 Tax=Sphingopyxis sp. BSNA05 TaxID=1236614 RepID=UPI0020B7848F|nr:ATP-binding protein [Sphingopyxis sp. BSNA05]
MIETLQDSADRMNGLLERLSQHNKSHPEEPKSVKVADLIRSIIEKKRLLHSLECSRVDDLTIFADPARVEQILGHLIQNAIDASTEDQPITINARRRDLSVAIEVCDQGTGMSAEFVRNQLFKPFSSSKQGGFGIGAYEARELARSMNGRLEVESTENVGSRFTLLLPLAKHLPKDIPADERAA